MGTVIQLKKQINNSYADLKNSVDDKLILGEEKINSRLASKVELVQKMTKYHLKTGGKRLRALLTLQCAKICGYQKGFRSGSTYTHTTNQDIIDIFIKRKPFMAVSFGTYKKDDEDTYSRAGGHALVLNGYEDGYLKIYDPWGKIYNVQFSKAKGKGIDGKT